jgi:hypothetical protein
MAIHPRVPLDVAQAAQDRRTGKTRAEVRNQAKRESEASQTEPDVADLLDQLDALGWEAEVVTSNIGVRRICVWSPPLP